MNLKFRIIFVNIKLSDEKLGNVTMKIIKLKYSFHIYSGFANTTPYT